MKHFLYSARNDRLGIVAVFIVVLVAVGFIIKAGRQADCAPAALADSLSGRSGGHHYAAESARSAGGYYAGEPVKELFPFDPNTADSTQLLRLGLKPWQVKNIYKYRARGGEYRRKEDFARLYGLTAADYRRLEPYIRIAGDYRPAAEVYGAARQDTHSRDTVSYPQKLSSGENVPLNAADTTQLRRVPGVGSHYARAIVALRQRLGGFYSVRQLLEISGFPEQSLPYFTVDASQCRRININKATLSQLRQHPYISFYMARAIIEHRRLHGRIGSLDELTMYRDFTPEAVSRLRAYVSF